jgi:hypothetical protein
VRWADALKASSDKRAVRPLSNAAGREEPNVLLFDQKFSTTVPKAFHAAENFGWRRVPLRLADNYSDWMPAALAESATPWDQAPTE